MTPKEQPRKVPPYQKLRQHETNPKSHKVETPKNVYDRKKEKQLRRFLDICSSRTAGDMSPEVSKGQNSPKPVVFLGGDCSDENIWRKELKKDYGDKIFFLDPYDAKWEAEDNIYGELAGIVTADHVIFYKGGDGTKKEKKFLELLGEDQNRGVLETNNLNDIKDYIEGLIKSSKKGFNMMNQKDSEKLAAITSELDSIAHEIQNENPKIALAIDTVSDCIDGVSREASINMGWMPGHQNGPGFGKGNGMLWEPGQKWTGLPPTQLMPREHCCPKCGLKARSPLPQIGCPDCGCGMSSKYSQELASEYVKSAKKKKKKWIPKDLEKGALHRYFKVKENEEIPLKMIQNKYQQLQQRAEGDKKLSKSDKKLFDRLQFALNMR